jgi:hypothetical protein
MMPNCYFDDVTKWGRVAAATARAANACVEIIHWFGTSRPNFEMLYLDQIEVDSADFWTNRLLLSSSRSAVEGCGAIRSITRTLKSD